MSTASFDNIQPSAGGTARKAVRGIAAAWANLNGTGTIALRDSENVSSVVDNGVGDYTFNFSNDMTNGNYSFPMSVGSQGAQLVNANIGLPRTAFLIRTQSRFISSTTGDATLADATEICLSILGDLA